MSATHELDRLYGAATARGKARSQEAAIEIVEAVPAIIRALKKAQSLVYLHADDPANVPKGSALWEDLTDLRTALETLDVQLS